MGLAGRWHLFGLYHLHLPWSIPANTLDTFFVSTRSSGTAARSGIAVHNVQTVVFTLMSSRWCCDDHADRHPGTRKARPSTPPGVRRHRARVGGTLFALSTLVEPGELFLLAGVYLGLAVRACAHTHERRNDRASDAPSPMRPAAELVVVAAGRGLHLSGGVDVLAIVLGGAIPIYVGVPGVLCCRPDDRVVVVNLAEELGWTGYFQGRVMLSGAPPAAARSQPSSSRSSTSRCRRRRRGDTRNSSETGCWSARPRWGSDS